MAPCRSAGPVLTSASWPTRMATPRSSVRTRVDEMSSRLRGFHGRAVSQFAIVAESNAGDGPVLREMQPISAWSGACNRRCSEVTVTMGRTSELAFKRGRARVHILLVDGDPARRGALRESLAQDGHEVVTIVAVTQLIFFIELSRGQLSPKPDVVLVDASMAEGAVFDVVRAGRDVLEHAALVLLFSHPPDSRMLEAGILDDLEPCAAFGPGFDEDDVRTLVINLPFSKRQPPRVSQTQLMAAPWKDKAGGR
jgi:CheY-like chemotaxis protein